MNRVTKGKCGTQQFNHASNKWHNNTHHTRTSTINGKLNPEQQRARRRAERQKATKATKVTKRKYGKRNDLNLESDYNYIGEIFDHDAFDQDNKDPENGGWEDEGSAITTGIQAMHSIYTAIANSRLDEDYPIQFTDDSYTQKEKNAANWSKVERKFAVALYDPEQKRHGWSCCENSPFCGRAKKSVLGITLGKTVDLEVTFCNCEGSKGAALISLGYFPCTPIASKYAIDITFLEFFHLVRMTGKLSSDSWSWAVQQLLLNKTQKSLPESFHRKYWTASYFAWRKATQSGDALFIEEAEATANIEVKPSHEYSEQCPACFYRPDERYPSTDPGFLSFDACMQFRHKIQGQKHYQPPLVDPWGTMFLKNKEVDKALVAQWEKDAADDAKRDEDVEKTDSCSRRFLAAEEAKERGKRFKGYDRSGVMNMVCRHDCCIAISDLTVGERFAHTWNFLEQVMEKFPKDAHFLCTYDIACSFGPHVKQRCKDWAPRIVFAINAFHAYAHSTQCQVTAGPLRCKGIGMSDGEGVERCWCRSCFLVWATRVGTLMHREILLTGCFEQMNISIRKVIGKTLSRKYFRATTVIREKKQGLADYEIKFQEKCWLTESEDIMQFLSEHGNAQSAWFSSREKTKIQVEKKRRYGKLLKLIKYEEKCQEEYDACNEKQLLDKLCYVPKYPPYNKYQTDSQNNSVNPRGWDPSGVMSHKAQLEQATAWVEAELLKQGQQRGFWQSHSKGRTDYEVAWICMKIEAKTLRLYRESAARSYQYRNLNRKQDFRGHKKSTDQIKKINRQSPKIQKAKLELNKLYEELQKLTGTKYQINPFDGKDLDLASGEEQYRIWLTLTFVESNLGFALDEKVQRIVENADLSDAIDLYYRLERAKEELVLLKSEWKRASTYVIMKINMMHQLLEISLNDLVPTTESFQSRTIQKMIEVFNMARGLVKCPGDIREAEILKELQGCMYKMRIHPKFVNAFQKEPAAGHGGVRVTYSTQITFVNGKTEIVSRPISQVKKEVNMAKVEELTIGRLVDLEILEPEQEDVDTEDDTGQTGMADIDSDTDIEDDGIYDVNLEAQEEYHENVEDLNSKDSTMEDMGIIDGISYGLANVKLVPRTK